jgi:hypothetical protein
MITPAGWWQQRRRTRSERKAHRALAQSYIDRAQDERYAGLRQELNLFLSGVTDEPPPTEQGPVDTPRASRGEDAPDGERAE